MAVSEMPPKVGTISMNPSHINAGIGHRRRLVNLVFILTLASALILVGVGSALAADSILSQCVACHTDAAKLKPLTPPDPPSTEEGEG